MNGRLRHTLFFIHYGVRTRKRKQGGSSGVSTEQNMRHLTDPSYMSNLCLQLREEIYKCKLETESYWPRFWAGDKTLNPGNVLSILDHLREFYVRMHAEYKELLAQLPPVYRWNAKAHQKFFTEYLSAQMKKTSGRPLDSIVAALAEVAFDLHHGVGSETVRGRRRVGKAPEKLSAKNALKLPRDVGMLRLGSPSCARSRRASEENNGVRSQYHVRKTNQRSTTVAHSRGDIGLSSHRRDYAVLAPAHKEAEPDQHRCTSAFQPG